MESWRHLSFAGFYARQGSTMAVTMILTLAGGFFAGANLRIRSYETLEVEQLATGKAESKIAVGFSVID